MKYRTERDEEIFRLWNETNLSFEQISKIPFPVNLSLRRIRCIVYLGRHRIKNQISAKIYTTFRLHFLQTQNVQASIWFAYENQPDSCISIYTVRKVINEQLKLKRISKSNQQILKRN